MQTGIWSKYTLSCVSARTIKTKNAFRKMLNKNNTNLCNKYTSCDKNYLKDYTNFSFKAGKLKGLNK